MLRLSTFGGDVLAVPLTGLLLSNPTAVLPTDSLSAAVGKLQAQFNLAWPLLTKAAGSVVLDFGSAPGGTDASVAITGQSAIIGTSLVDAWVSPAVTADHGVDEHWAEDIIVSAGNVVAGTGFTVYGKSATGTYGKFNIVWAWV